MIIYRYNRCNDSDVAALKPWFTSKPSDKPQVSSPLLTVNVILSELWNYDNPPKGSDLEKISKQTYISTPDITAIAKTAGDVWPRYKRDSLHRIPMQYDGPLLMLQGGLDPATTIEEVQDYEHRYNAQYQTFAYFPTATHDISILECGENLVAQFVEDPTSVLDQDCIDTASIVDFSPDTEDYWGD